MQLDSGAVINSGRVAAPTHGAAMHPYVKTGLIALAAFAVAAVVNSTVSIPVIGAYLPKKSA